MAPAKFSDPTAEAPAPGGSMMKWLATMLALTLVAVAGGGALGSYLVASIKRSVESKAKPDTTTVAEGKAANDMNLRDLPPVVTNLAEPADAWVRVQASIVFDPKLVAKPDVLAAQISEDIMGFMKTVSLTQIGGASGLQHLREDLNERAMIRSDGKVRELIIEALVVQ